MIARLFRATLCVWALVTAGAVQAEWHEASSDHFLVIADQNEKDVREFTERLNAFTALFSISLRGKMRRPAHRTG